MTDQKRPYRMKKRAESQEQTRLRITESAVALHGSIGPAQTSMAAVAEHAGVQRSTLYRHFPDEAALFEACSSHWREQHPYPQIELWPEIADPDERLEAALTELYGFYRGTGVMLDNLLRDEHLNDVVRERFAGFHQFLAAAREILMAGRGTRGKARERMAAAVGLAVRFETWRALCREGGLSDQDAVRLMTGLVSASVA
jgi:AcrR family transcriptional regulator